MLILGGLRKATVHDMDSAHWSVRIACCLVGMITFIGTSAAPGTPEIRFEQLEMAHGLSQSGLRAVVQDQKGYIWFGNQYGLDRFNGYEFTPFRHDSEDPWTLSDNRIQSLLVSRAGDLWVGTPNGLNRLNPDTGRVDRIEVAIPGISEGDRLQFNQLLEDDAGNFYALTSAGPIYRENAAEGFRRLSFSVDRERPAGRTARAVLDHSDRLWLADEKGLWRLDGARRRFDLVLDEKMQMRQGSSGIVMVTPDGDIGVATPTGAHILDADSSRLKSRIRPTRHGHDTDSVLAMATDSHGHYWLLLPDALVRTDPAGETWRVLAELSGPEAGARSRLQLAQCRNGHVWLAGHFGLARYDPESGKLVRFEHDPRDPGSLGPTTADAGYRILLDRDGVLWVGGGLGTISRFVPESARFQLIQDQRSDGPFAGYNVVRSVLASRQNGREFLWTGLDSAGLRLLRRDSNGQYEVVRRYHSQAPPSRRLPDDSVRALARDPLTSRIWGGTGQGLVVFDGESGDVEHTIPIRIDDRSPNVRSLVFSSDGQRLWVGTRNGLFVYRFEGDRIQPKLQARHFVEGTAWGDDENQIFNMLELSDGRLLVATRMGFSLVDADGSRIEHFYPGAEARDHPRNYIFGLSEEPEGTYWLGTRDAGIARVRLVSEENGAVRPVYRWYTTEDGLVNDTIYAIEPDQEGSLWLSSNQGLMRFDPDTGEVRQYGPEDGLQHYEFSHAVSDVSPSGRFYFGGIQGVNAFRPDEIKPHPNPPRIHLEEARINGQPARLGDNEASVLELSHDQNRLTLEFVGLHFVDPARNRYGYRLEGLEPEWVESGSQRVVRYPSLPPGEYRFWVRAANSDGVWSEPKMLLQATVKPPPWLTPWAYAAYVLGALLVVATAVGMQYRRRRKLEKLVARRTVQLEEKKEQVSRQAVALEEALEARTVLFANVSHEFRTPLTLIQAAFDRLERSGAEESAIELGRRYSRRLLRLVDQLLDLSRLRVKHSRSEASWALDEITNMTVEAFRSMAEQRDIQLEGDIESGWRTRCAQDQVEKILFNLISNAIKYTPEGGRVCVSLKGANDQAEISVADDGPGIAREEQGSIFERFHRTQAAERTSIHGAGIGLALVREAALANGGDVSLESEPGRGSRFTVTLPAKQAGDGDEETRLRSRDRLDLELAVVRARPQVSPEFSSGPEGDGLGTVLVVEDNADLRRHLHEILAPEWEVLMAVDGREGLEKARRDAPDLVVSDIMMPELDGFEMLKAIRGDLDTSHIPVLLLTARQDAETRLQGYTLSADDFLAKPFVTAELRLRLKRMLESRTRLQKYLAREFESETDSGSSEGGTAPPGNQLTERDQQFLDRIDAWLEANFDDIDKGVESLANALPVDTRTLQRKLKALTNLTPGEYLQRYRLARARELLQMTDRSVNEIALSCGFSSQQYFTRVFRRVQGEPPGSWRRKHPKPRQYANSDA